MNAALNRYVSSLPRTAKRIVVLLLDANICIASVLCAYYLRLGYWAQLDRAPLVAAATSIALLIPIFTAFGLYRAVFRYFESSSIARVTQAVFVYAILYSIIFTSIGFEGVPRTVGLIQPILVYILVPGSRFLAFAIFNGRIGLPARAKGQHRVLIYGAGEAGRQLALATRMDKDIKLVGFVDDDAALIGRTLTGIPIFGPVDVASVALRKDVSEVLLAIPSASRSRRMEIVRGLMDAGLKVRTLPGISDIARGRVSVTDLREVQIEDLLGRASVRSDAQLVLRTIRDKVVMVTGAGGSIGSELARQIHKLGPARLILVDISEYNLYAISQELAEEKVEGGNPEQVPLLASVCDEARMRQIIALWRPETIYHAAAYKHVPLVEWNVVEGVRNNVIGTLTTARIARDYGVQSFTLVSTDKAVRPTNVMGASKRLAEMILQVFDQEVGKPCFSMVRFGNVLGSSGSVVPLFRKQIASGGPVTVTDERMTRYFMTIPEAAQLVLQASAMARGGDVFLLDMGEPVRIIDLARNMIELSGLRVMDSDTPDGDIAIEIVGLRPGEKLYEELLIEADAQPTSHPRIMRAIEKRPTSKKLNEYLDELNQALLNCDGATVRSILRTAVPEFTPSSDLTDLAAVSRDAAAPSAVAENTQISA